MPRWPFGEDADQDDPLTALRIAVTCSHPSHSFLVCFDRESPARPTDAEAAILASFLDEYKHRWYGDSRFARVLASKPLDVDGGANGTVFRKYAPDDWGYRKMSQFRGPMFFPQPPSLGSRSVGPLGLEALMDQDHSFDGEGPRPRWLEWKAKHPDVFSGA